MAYGRLGWFSAVRLEFGLDDNDVRVGEDREV